jgi:hypothetical protein
MKKIILGVFLSLNVAAFADEIHLNQPIYGGNGCPQGTASAVLSPDKTSLSILFDQYAAEAGRSAGKSLDRKTCNIAIPVHVPNGMSVSLFQIDYRGFASVPQGGSCKLNVDYFFAGQSGPTYQKTFTGPMSNEYTARNTLAVGAVTWSPCGQDVNLRVNTSMTAQSNRYMEDTLGTVDSADIQAGLVYHLRFRSCR